MSEMICYCFGFTAEDIERDYQKNGSSTIMEKIRTEKKIGNCQCALENPKGRWCLGDVRQVVDKLKGRSPLTMLGWNISNLNWASKLGDPG